MQLLHLLQLLHFYCNKNSIMQMLDYNLDFCAFIKISIYGNRGLVEFHEIFSVYSIFQKKKKFVTLKLHLQNFQIINQNVIFFQYDYQKLCFYPLHQQVCAFATPKPHACTCYEIQKNA